MATNGVGAGGTGYQDSRPPLHTYAGEFTDIDAAGDEAAGKRHKRTVTLFGSLHDRDLLVSKLFYFCFFSAFGALFPLLSIYFKQLGMSATQAGLLIGVRPFVEFASIPFWSSFADKFRQGKNLLLFCIFSWLVSTYMLNYMRPEPVCCLDCAETPSDTQLTDSCWLLDVKGNAPEEGEPKQWNRAEAGAMGISPIDAVSEIDPSAMEEKKAEGEEVCTAWRPESPLNSLLRPRYSARVYKSAGIESAFVIMFLIVCIGEFLSSPAVSLADGCTLSYLKDQPDHYGRQRLFGSTGWALAILIMGAVLDWTTLPNHPCGTLEEREKNYQVCFVAFSLLMICTFIVATQFSFPEDDPLPIRPDEIASKLVETQECQVEVSRAQSLRQSAATAAAGSGPRFVTVLRTFSAPNHLVFLVVTIWFGMGIGLIFSFLFWHLQDIEGSPLLFGLASIVNHISELIAYFYSFAMINKHGHLKILYIGLAANVLRFLYIALIPNAWLVLPIELLQVWSAASTYISLVAPTEQKSDAQHMISALHHGVGKGIGALLGGVLISSIGSRITFVIYGAVSVVLLIIWVVLNRIFNVDHAPVAVSAQDAAGHLAPHGVPLTVPYNKSSSNLRDQTPQKPAAPAPDPTQDAYDRYVMGQ